MKKRALTFYGINLMVTLLMALAFGGGLGRVVGDGPALGLLVTLGVQLSPMVAAWLCFRRYKAKPAYSLSVDRHTLLALLLPCGIMGVAALLMSWMGIPYRKSEFSGWLLLLAIATSLAGAYAEEVGWRGCLYDMLRRECSPLVASLWVGLLWGLWHLFKVASVGWTGYLLFVPTIVLFSLLMGYVYEKSHRSLTHVVLFHFCINLSTLLMLYGRECHRLYVVLFLVELAVVLPLLCIAWKKNPSFFAIESGEEGLIEINQN